MHLELKYYLAHGVTSSNIEGVTNKFYIQEFVGGNGFNFRYIYPGDEIIYDLNSLCVSLYDVFRDILFPDTTKYMKKCVFNHN
jgi:hypothetical protein